MCRLSWLLRARDVAEAFRTIRSKWLGTCFSTFSFINLCCCWSWMRLRFVASGCRADYADLAAEKQWTCRFLPTTLFNSNYSARNKVFCSKRSPMPSSFRIIESYRLWVKFHYLYEVRYSMKLVTQSFWKGRPC